MFKYCFLAVIFFAGCSSDDIGHNAPLSHPAVSESHPKAALNNTSCKIGDKELHDCANGRSLPICTCFGVGDPDKSNNEWELKMKCDPLELFDSRCESDIADSFCETADEVKTATCEGGEVIDRCVCAIKTEGGPAGLLRWDCEVTNASLANHCRNEFMGPEGCYPLCGASEVCDECASSSCSGCDDCVPGCVPM